MEYKLKLPIGKNIYSQDEDGEYPVIEIRDSENNDILLNYRTQDIEDYCDYIVHCCNNYPKLQDACKELVEALEMQHRDWLEMYMNHWNEDREENIMPKVESVIAKAKEVLSNDNI